MSSPMEMSPILYRPIEYVERMEYYEPGGYHPVKIGDYFLNRYRIVHKLGHGTYSTIWLAQDETSNKNVAVKVCRASFNALEIGMLAKLSAPSSDRGRAIIPSILDRFNIQGPNGDHKYGEPEFEPVNRLDGQKLPTGVPEHGVVPIWLGEASENVTLLESRILLSDFGEAFSPAQEKKFESHAPLLIRPPEARFEPTKSLTSSSDIWSLACTIWDIIAQKTLFEGIMTDEDDMTCQQIGLLGPLPTEWQEKHGESIHQSKYLNRSLEGHFEKTVQKARIRARMPSLGSEEQNALLSMFRSMLSFKPENRPSAQQVLESEWMVNWALPEYEKIRNSQCYMWRWL
ncbi:hypothetical protein AWENTII_000235 [Aspergillus wentii]